MSDVLIIDDDKKICKSLANLLTYMGYGVQCAFTLKDGLKTARRGMFDVVFLDVRLPDGNGLQTVPQFREVASSPEVIIITGEGDADGAELAIKSGAWDYVEKPSSIEALKLPLVRALQYREQERGRKLPVALQQEGIVGNSSALKACLDFLARAANSEANVLITGETGTGKELFARAIHDNSARHNGNFVVVDCGALPATLVESMLFGHEKGAFTGADTAREGLIKQADGGTLLLDEVGELPLSIQTSFLRALQERRFRPIGGRQEVGSDFRLVAATSRDLDKMVENGTFRSDLLFRLRSITVGLPPLKDRMEDIKDLTTYHMNRLCERYRVGTKGFSPDFLDALASYEWPGNVRELVNTLEAALVSAQHEPTMFAKYLPANMRISMATKSLNKKKGVRTIHKEMADSSKALPEFRNHLDKCKEQYVKDLMALSKNDIGKACQISGMSRSSLYDHLKKYNVPIPR